MSGRAARVAVVLIAVPIAAAGCTSSGSKPKASSPVTTPAASSVTFASSSAPAPSASGSESITKTQARGALLTPAEFGTGFTHAPSVPSNESLPCTPNAAPLEQQIPSTLQVDTAAVSTDDQAGMKEDLRLYPDAATAKQVYQLATRGISCKRGKLNLTGKPETVTFTSAQDARSAVRADNAVVVEAKSANYDIALIGCRLGRALVLFSFLRTKDSDISKLPNPITVAAKGVAKIKRS
jgi:hypothetical protein